MRSDDRHTKIVKIARIGMPIAALLLIAAIFLFEESNALRDDTFVVTDKIRDAALNQKVVNPQFAGITRDDDAFTISATEAIPNSNDGDQLALKKPTIKVDTNSGIVIDTTANQGQIDFKTNEASLSGSVNLTASNGVSVTSDLILFDLDSGSVQSPGQITAQAPIGQITAGNMQANRSFIGSSDEHDNIINFAGGVRVLYKPSGNYKE